MKIKNEDFEVLVPDIEGTGVAERVKVKIPLKWDEDLEQWILTPEAHQIIDDTKSRHMGLLLPAQFKELRERYGYSQKQMGELFQVGEKSWTRWESGRHRPSRSINLLIRALYEGEVSLNYLLRRAGKSTHEEADLQVFAFHTFYNAWGIVRGWTHRDINYSAQSKKPVHLGSKANSETQKFLHHILKAVQQNQGSAKQSPCAKSGAICIGYSRAAPSHAYRQPRLTTPTVA